MPKKIIPMHTYLGGLLILLIVLLPVTVTAAHPLGNFTINRYSRLQLGTQHLLIDYIVDMAEVPALQEMARIDTDGNQLLTTQEEYIYLQTQAAAIRAKLTLTLNGTTPPLQPTSAQLTSPPGEGGLQTVRLELTFFAPLPPASTLWEVRYIDDNFLERELGWQEIIVQPWTGVTLLTTTVPLTDESNRLTAYPERFLSDPLTVSRAALRFGLTDSLTSADVATAQAVPLPDLAPTPPVQMPIGAIIPQTEPRPTPHPQQDPPANRWPFLLLLCGGLLILVGWWRWAR